MAFLKIFGDWKGAREALNGVARHAKKVNAQIKSSFSGLNSFFSKVFSPLGFGLGGLGITTVFTQIVNKLDAIGKSSANMGVSAEYFQKMNFAAERTGTSIDQVREAFAKVQALVGKFMTGDKNAAGIMGQLGLTREDLAGLNAEQTFDKVNRALRGIGDEQTRNAVAAKLYGETFQKLNNFLRDYVDLGEEAQSRGLIVSDETIKAAEDLKDAMTNAGTAFMAALAATGAIEYIRNLAEGAEAIANMDRMKTEKGVKERDVRSWFRRLIESSYIVGPKIAELNEKHFGPGFVAYTGKSISQDAWKINVTPELLAGIGGKEKLAEYVKALDAAKNSISDLKNSEAIYLNNSGSFAELEKRTNELLEKRAADRGAAAEAAAIDEADEVFSKQLELEAEANKKSDEYIENLKKQLRYQQLIYQGKEKEAAIEKQLEAARAKAGGTLSPEREAEIRRLAGQMYDLQHPEPASASGAAALSSRIAEYPTDALRRIGGYSGAFNSSNPSLNYQRKSTDFLDKINQRVSSIEQNLQTSGTSGATFP